jgi:hypothetical protein
LTGLERDRAGIARTHNRDRHEGGMRIGPGERLTLCLEEAINDERAFFKSGAAGEAGGLSISHRAARVDGCESLAVWQLNPTPIRDVPGVDRAMTGA